MENYERTKSTLKQIVINNFVGGISWAFGATVGISIIIALLSILAKNINLIPFIGNFASQVTHYVLQTNPQLVK
ncbi:MAG: DUF5665 domain-containing protein [Patescibacteria group bacterium]|nr:DUF5665 domain-containing protein [Patescibacteria group bacterium]